MRMWGAWRGVALKGFAQQMEIEGSLGRFLGPGGAHCGREAFATNLF